MMGNLTGNADKKNLRKRAKMIKQAKDAGICRNKKEKATQEKITIKLDEINQKILTKEGSLKKPRLRVNTDKTGHTNNQMQKKPNDFGQK